MASKKEETAVAQPRETPKKSGGLNFAVSATHDSLLQYEFYSLFTRVERSFNSGPLASGRWSLVS